MPDIIIVGAGTAGLTASIYTIRAGKSALVLESTAYGGQIINTPDIENYPGLKHVSGYDFATALYEQAKELGADIRFETVTGIESSETGEKIVHTNETDYRCSAVILATGAKNRPLGVDRESELIGSGVSYCATCDGMFFRRKNVAVVGGGNTALEDAAFLSNFCSHVYLIHRRDTFRGDEKDVDLLRAKENVTFVLNSNVTRLIGDNSIEGIEVANSLSGETTVLAVTGIFIAVGQAPDNQAFSNIVSLNSSGYIEADENCETSAPGIFTAGDCRTKTVRQLTTAAADGAVAALAACNYVAHL